MTAVPGTMPAGINILRANPRSSIFAVSGPGTLAIKAGTTITVGETTFAAAEDAPLPLPELVAGTDYAVHIEGGQPVAEPCGDGAMPSDVIGGFHFAPGGNAEARAGGDAVPAINPCSCWDAGFRPACPDPRGMALIEQGGLRFWCDIYLLGADHLKKGTSRFGETIADGAVLPTSPDGKGTAKKLDYATAVAIYARHGKQLLSYDEFRVAAFGAAEKTATAQPPKVTGLDAARTSRHGVMQATGNMWAWGHDGDPDAPRPSICGGSWLLGDRAGSRCAYLGYWPGVSVDVLSARGRSDHLMLD